VPGLVHDLNTIHKIITPLRRKVLSAAITSIANAEGLANLSRSADPQIIEVIPNGVDTDFYKPAEKDEPNSIFNFIFVGRFHEQKNLFYLLEQYKRIVGEHENCHLHLVGDGALNEKLREASKVLALEKFITWHGWLKKDELKSLYQINQCMINPSHYEGLPNTVLEGMACALPVIVSNVPGNNDLICEEENGYLFKIGDQDGLYNCMKKVLMNENYTAMGEQGRSKVLNEYTWAMVAEQYETCLMRDQSKLT
jgi:glycosyltransferase involved in cell wall biosynthesis